MITTNKALSIIKNNTKQISKVKVKSECAIGEILAQSVRATIHSPPFDMSSMDGFAIKLIKNKKKPIKKYKVVKEIFAGDANKKTINNEEAIRIYTGGKIPKGVNKVIIQENVKILNKNYISINQALYTNNYIRKKGQDYKKGEILLRKGKKINSRDIGLLLSSGINEILVYRNPKVVIIATGNELVGPEKKLSNSKIYSSSVYMLKNLLHLSGAKCIECKVIKDDETLIKKYINTLEKVDIIITTGGVSVGKKDLVKSVFDSLGMKRKFWKVSIKPGKPILYGMIKKTHIFGLPGNPVSTYVCYLLFVLETISIMKGHKNNFVVKEEAMLTEDLINNSIRESYYRGHYIKNNNKFSVKTLKNQDSSLLNNLSLANCLIKIPANINKIIKGTYVKIILLDNGF